MPCQAQRNPGPIEELQQQLSAAASEARAILVECWAADAEPATSLAQQREKVRVPRPLIIANTCFRYRAPPRHSPLHAQAEAYVAMLQKQQRLEASIDAYGRRTCRSVRGTMEEVPPEIVSMIDERLPEAVTYRRRDFEAPNHPSYNLGMCDCNVVTNVVANPNTVLGRQHDARALPSQRRRPALGR